MAEHEADEVVFAAGIAVPVLHRRQPGVVVQQQIVLEKEKADNDKRNQTREQMVMEWQLTISREERRKPAGRPSARPIDIALAR